MTDLKEDGHTVWDAEARMAKEGDWRGVAYSIAHDILPPVPGGSADHAWQERARKQMVAAARLQAAIREVLPPGWVVVPRHASKEMVEAGGQFSHITDCWSAMVEAAPNPRVAGAPCNSCGDTSPLRECPECGN